MVLDSANNVFVGPNGYFKIVIDDFDGTRINAWHFEDADGNKSVNRARLSTGGHIDLLAKISCGTGGSFATRDIVRRMENEQAAAGLIMKK